MFEFIKRPPEIPKDLDFLANGKEKEDVPEEAIDVPVVKRVSKRSAPNVRLRVFACGILFVGVIAGSYFFFSLQNLPVPAAISQGDALISGISDPTAAVLPKELPGDTSPEPPKAAEQHRAPSPSAMPPISHTVIDPSNMVPPQSDNTHEKVETTQQNGFTGPFGVNPFVDLSTLRGVAASSSSGTALPYIGASGNRALPDIPRPDVSPDLLPSPGEIKTPAGPVGAAVAPSTMGGIIKSANGNAIAIMGDGTVLSEGDSYQGDRRVTFIGGDGLQFDNGDSIPFGSQKE